MVNMNGARCLRIVNAFACSRLINSLKHLTRCESLRYSSQDSPMNVFDRKTKRIQKERAASLEDHTVYDYIKEEVGWRTADRLFDIKRNFCNVLDLGSGKGFVGRNLLKETIGSLHQTEITSKLLHKSVTSSDVPTSSVVVDEEFIPFRNDTFDLVVSNLSLHWVNNLPSTIEQVNRILTNDGCFIGTMFGGDTLHELRVSLYLAELERKGGFSPHISPYTSAQDLGGLLHRAGFVMLTIDVDDIIINYPSIVELMYDLKGMGESSCSWNRCLTLPRETLLAAGAIYRKKFGSENSKDEAGNDVGPSVPALFQIINFIAWKPDKSQQQAAKRGSGEVSLKEVGNLEALAKQIEELRKDKKLDERTLRSVEELHESAQKLFKSKDDDDKKDS